MLVLALDTSSAAVTAGIVEVGADAVTERASRVHVNARGHGELLAPGIAGCLRDVDATPRDLAAIVAGLGPGPFTGLRVGLVTAAVMAETLGIPAYGVCSLDAIAAAAQDESDLLVATDARRKEVYWARYDAAGERVDGPHVARPADVPLDGITSIAGAGGRLYAFDRQRLDVDHPPVLALAALAADRIRVHAPSEQLTPLYLRRPDAQVPTTHKQVSQ